MSEQEKFKALEVLPKEDGLYIVSLFEIGGEYKGKHHIRLRFKNGAWDYGMRKGQYVGYIEAKEQGE